MTTVIFTGGAGLIAVLLAVTVALAAASDTHLRLTNLAVLLALLAMPPAHAALGVTRVSTHPPPPIDWLTRHEFTVALCLGFRLFPFSEL